MKTELEEQVCVITGASSGIGRETAVRLASKGAKVMLAARDEAGLREVAEEIRNAGGRAEYHVTDVSDSNQVESLADRTVQEFGRIDSWINNAGVAIYGDISEITHDEMKRVIEVNLLGEMYGSKAAFERMKNDGAGVIVNVSSALARRSVPLQSAYCAAKHGVTGFTEALRIELQQNWPDIRVVEVLPSSINTPFFAHARSKMGVAPRPISPVYQPSLVAQVIERACVSPRREMFVGGSGKSFDVAQRLAPGFVDWYLRRGDRGVREQQDEENQTPSPQDNLFEPIQQPAAATGDWSDEAHDSSMYTTAVELKRKRTMLLALATLGGMLAVSRRDMLPMRRQQKPFLRRMAAKLQ